MKKILIAITFVLLFGLVACDRTTKDATIFYDYLNNTREVYEESDSSNVKITIENGNVLTEFEYVYNLSANVFTDLKLVHKEDDNIMAAYVKDGVSYMNVNGELTEAPFEDGDDLVEKFGLAVIMDDAYKLFDISLMNAFEITSDEEGVAQLVWDIEKYVFLDEDIGDDVEEWTAADERFRFIKENVTEITATIHYAEEEVSLLESSWTYNDDSVKKIKIEFNGTETQTIEIPDDFN